MPLPVPGAWHLIPHFNPPPHRPQLFTVDQSYRVRLQFSMYKDEVGANLEAIKQ